MFWASKKNVRYNMFLQCLLLQSIFEAKMWLRYIKRWVKIINY